MKILNLLPFFLLSIVISCKNDQPKKLSKSQIIGTYESYEEYDFKIGDRNGYSEQKFLIEHIDEDLYSVEISSKILNKRYTDALSEELYTAKYVPEKRALLIETPLSHVYMKFTEDFDTLYNAESGDFPKDDYLVKKK